MIFICKWTVCTLIRQSRVIIEERLRIKVINKFILLSKNILQIFLDGIFFLTRGTGLSILESIISNDIKRNTYRQSNK